MSSPSQSVPSSPDAGTGVIIERTGDVLAFTLNNPVHGNEVTGAMFDAMLAELLSEASEQRGRVLRIRARGKVFCSGRERAGRDAASIRHETARLVEFKRDSPPSPLLLVAEVPRQSAGL